MIWVTPKFHRNRLSWLVVNRNDPTAAIGAVMMAGANNGSHGPETTGLGGTDSRPRAPRLSCRERN
jgi:hypothetical protein